MHILSGQGEDNTRVDTIQEAVDMLNLPEYKELTSMMNTFPRLGRILDVVLAKDERTGRYITEEVAYTDENGDPATRLRYITNEDISGVYFNMFMSELASGSASFQGIASANRYATAKMATEMYQKAMGGKALEAEEQEYLSAVVGENLAGMISRVSPLLLETQVDTYATQRGGANRFNISISEDGKYDYSALPQDVQDWLNSEFKTDQDRYNATVDAYLEYADSANRQIASLAFSATEKDYVETVLNNARLGLSGLTSIQRSEGAKDIIANIQNRQLSTYLEQDDAMIQEYASAYENLPVLMSMAQSVEEKTAYDIFDLESLEEGSSGYIAIEDALRSAGFSISDAQTA